MLVRVRAVDVRQGPPVPVIYNILTDTATGTCRLTLSHTHTHTHTHTLTGCMCVCGSVYRCAQRKPLNGTTLALGTRHSGCTLLVLDSQEQGFRVSD